MASEREVQRLQAVYQEYQADEAVQARWSSANPGNRANDQARRQRLRRMLEEAGVFPLTDQRILDVGCGSGHVLAGLIEWGASAKRLYGVDLVAERIEAARRRLPEADFRQANAETLDFDDACFDLVFLFTVFTSILDETMARNVAQEVRRVLKPGGAVVWYDFRRDNPRNPHVRGVPRREIATLFPGFEIRLHTVTLLPPLARHLGKLTPVLYPILTTFPLLRTHLLGLLIKPYGKPVRLP